MLERRAQAEKPPFQDVQRAMIVLYAADGLHDTEIAAKLDTSPSLVGRWPRRFAELRLDGPTDKPRAGRPTPFFPPRTQVAAVKAVACELPARCGLALLRFSRAELYRVVIELAAYEASTSTVWWWLLWSSWRTCPNVNARKNVPTVDGAATRPSMRHASDVPRGTPTAVTVAQKPRSGGH